ncbi:MAG: CHAT domain-containing protein [Ktedonobacteraceae bacterium]
MKNKAQTNVLLAFANPISTARLQLDTEARAIQQSIERSKYRDNINLVTRQAATIKDFRRVLLEETFQVIHISGHGNRNGLLLANDRGGQYIVDPPTLLELFQRYPSISCVLLNACYSTVQGRLLASSIPFTIAMDTPITDDVAIAFSCGFYDALGAGHPIDFAFEEGIFSIKSEVSPYVQLPRLIRKGETVSEASDEEGGESSSRSHFKRGKFLVAFAIDLSGSMDQSIRNRADVDTSRLKSLDQSLDDLIKNARESLEQSKARDIETSLDLFAYGFGLRTLAVCDLFSLIKAGRAIITDEVINEYTEEYKQRYQTENKAYEEASDVAKSLGLGGLWAVGEDFFKRQAKDKIIRRIIRDKRPQIEARLKRIGNTTLSFEEVAEMWESSQITLSNVKGLIFGNTPVKEVLTEITNRFARELQKRDTQTQSILFLVSDGKFTEVDPRPLAEKLRKMGVTIISCIIHDEDTANPRVLLNTADPCWGPEATLMFELSSPMGDLPEVRRYLLEHNWTIYPHPKLFVQLNHSDVLREFVQVTLSMLEDSEAAHTLPKGW